MSAGSNEWNKRRRSEIRWRYACWRALIFWYKMVPWTWSQNDFLLGSLKSKLRNAERIVDQNLLLYRLIWKPWFLAIRRYRRRETKTMFVCKMTSRRPPPAQTVFTFLHKPWWGKHGDNHASHGNIHVNVAMAWACFSDSWQFWDTEHWDNTCPSRDRRH